jgi:hypothetical protein
MGLAVALPLEQKYIGFSEEAPNGQKWRLVLRVVIGLLLVIGLLAVLKPFLPTEVVWLRALRYFITVIVGVNVWPFIFKKANL